ncbi:hypothetical protein CIG19_13810 [Enterobacterales bacterium CwR94]|nr:hypothetical protein CIG19_13810 [Enterobacterales bacterium CwR94]
MIKDYGGWLTPNKKMNKIYSVIWNAATQTWIAVSEFSGSKKKSKSRKRVIRVSTLVALCSVSSSVFAGTCLQGDVVNSSTTGGGSPATCAAWSIAIGAGSGSTATNFGVAIGDASNATGENSVAIGRQTVANVANATTLGSQSKAYAIGSTSVGQDAQVAAGATLGTAVGNSSRVTAANGTAIGTSSAAAASSVALGYNAKATGTNSISIGTGNVVSGNNSGAIGDPSTITGTGSYSLGNDNNIDANNAFAIGNNINIASGLNGAVALGNNSTVEAATATTGTTLNGTAYTFAGSTPAAGDVVSVGRAGAERQISHVAAGRLTNTSTDAVNGSQLFATNQAVNSLGTSLNTLDATVGNLGNDVSALDTQLSSVVNDGAGIKYFHANSTLADSSAVGVDSIAIGPEATATEDNSVAIGKGATTQATVARLGDTLNGTAYTYAGNAPVGGVSIGSVGAERQLMNVAAGQVAQTSTDAVNGSQLFATNSAVNALGSSLNTLDGTVTDLDTTVSDLDTTVSGLGITLNDMVNNGSGLKYFHSNSTLADSIATGADSVAIGPQAVASEDNSVAIGRGATTEAAVATASGTVNGVTYAYAGDTPAGVFSIGSSGAERQLTHVAAGQLSATSTDAVNGSQLFATNSAVTLLGSTLDGLVINGSGIKYFHTNSSLNDSSATGLNSVAIGPVASATEENSLAMGNGASANHSNSVALGAGSMTSVGAESNYAAYRLSALQNSIGEIAIGGLGGNRKITGVAAGTNDTDAVNVAQLMAVGNQVDQNSSLITNLTGRVTSVENRLSVIPPGGSGSQYVSSNSSGAAAVASGADSLAVGPNAQSTGDNSIAMGNGAKAEASGSVALGANASDGNRGAETYTGKYSNATNDSVGTISVGNAATGETRTVSNVADGVLANDAVNVRQLDGAVAESKKYTDDSLKNLNADVAQVGSSISDLQQGKAGMVQVNSTNTAAPKVTGGNSIAAGAGSSATASRSTAMGDGAVAKNTNSVALGANSVTDRDNSVSVGSAGNERQITHVATGTRDTDAVNVAQLNSSVANITNTSNAYTDRRFSELKDDLDKQNKTLSAGIAGAMAMASLPQPNDAGANMMALGGASYRGESALSLGVSRLSENGRWVTKAQINTNTQHSVGWGVGVGFQF